MFNVTDFWPNLKHYQQLLLGRQDRGPIKFTSILGIFYVLWVTLESTSVELRISLSVAQWNLFDSGVWIYGLDSLIAFVEKDHKSGKICKRIPMQDLITDFYCMGEGRRKVLIKRTQFLCTVHYTFFLLRISFSPDNQMSNFWNA